MKRFADLPEHTQLYLSALLADVNYLKGSGVYCSESDRHQYNQSKRLYEAACEREGVRPYDELV